MEMCKATGAKRKCKSGKAFKRLCFVLITSTKIIIIIPFPHNPEKKTLPLDGMYSPNT